ncbi:hypothetical protein GCK72_008184 [Caenorhabditis remanei]|uniref:Uncharacterized protein n=1 Tax=Caenorhabditis remanei TaxID=31234 RepID=A0A6A5GZ20_CAERE|nr:hypothetical protein GCK72_008184 [Caenorhabditis remanei]KAF1759939.1 hypothetical protein GCK72_008184 [Caenorhabditis remanei]
MSAIVATIESKINDYLQTKNKEDWKEKTFTQAEKFSGVPRERIVSMSILMLAIYVLLGNFLPLFSHVICIFWPVKESFKILRQQQKPSDNILLYWILYAIVSLFDFSALPGVPFYYFAKTGLFLSITTNGIDKLKEWSEPALKFTESWVLVTPQPEVIEEHH